jgi:GNAT superfamily N-acetyltransferase
VPDYWRRGIAKKLLKWGIGRARKEAVALLTFAGNTWKTVYLKHGFQDLGRLRIQAPDEFEVVYAIAMAWELRGEDAETAL